MRAREAQMATTAEDGARALATLLVGRYGYDGDRLPYDDPQNADFIAVIDRRRGLPVALGILYIHAARAAGFEAVGLNSPGHFLLRITLRSGEALIDPFNGGAALERESLGAPPAHGRARRGRHPSRRAGQRHRCAAAAGKQSEDARAADGRTHARAGDRQAHGADRAAPARIVDRSRRGSTKPRARSAPRRKPSKPVFRLLPPGDALHNEAALGFTPSNAV